MVSSMPEEAQQGQHIFFEGIVVAASAFAAAYSGEADIRRPVAAVQTVGSPASD